MMGESPTLPCILKESPGGKALNISILIWETKPGIMIFNIAWVYIVSLFPLFPFSLALSNNNLL